MAPILFLGSGSPLSSNPGGTPSPPLFSLSTGSAHGAVPGIPGTYSNPRAAVQRLQQRLKDHPKDVAARVALLAQLDLAGRASEAEDLIRAALQQGQRDPRLYHALGMLFMRHKLYDAAVEEFRCEVQVAPNDAQANLRLAECYCLVGQRERSRVYFEKVLKLKPSEPDIYIGLAYLNSSNQRAPHAIKYLKKFIELSKEPGQGYLLLSRIYVNQSRCAEAIEVALKGIAAMPDNADMWYNLGQAYSYSRDSKVLGKAEEAFLHAIRLAPDHGHGHFELGGLYTRQGRIAEAEAQYAQAAQCEPLSGRYHYQYGRSLVRSRRQAEADRELARARELLPLNQRESHLIDRLSAVPGDAKAWCELGTIYRKYGNHDMARACAERSLSISPAYTAARSLHEEVATAMTSPPARQ